MLHSVDLEIQFFNLWTQKYNKDEGVDIWSEASIRRFTCKFRRGSTLGQLLAKHF